MSIPEIPPAIGMAIFGLLVMLILQKEVLRVMGRAASRRQRVTSNWLIGILLVSYGGVLLIRFLSLL